MGWQNIGIRFPSTVLPRTYPRRFRPFGYDDDPYAAWQLRRAGRMEIERLEEMTFMKDIFLGVASAG